ncbi:hypothetical protein GCM10022291_30760 [Postechiella marina]|uniref:Deoxyribose-phosphate aldolase n=2 Tax=Postechiella marina TaxID=943941 RepID=A0ABP8CGJ2_9FLAO
MPLIFVFACKTEKQRDANTIIDKAIAVSGGHKIDASKISFTFRDKFYSATRNKGEFLLTRSFVSTKDSIQDLLNNEGFNRLVNKKKVKVIDSMATKYAASVNSVHYFSVLPYGLQSNAVNKTFLGETKIKNTAYYKIKVTFDEAGGGEDFEDVFVYWVNKETFKVDYLAYSYEEGKGIGFRFREAYNERYIKGIRFVDYNNYKPQTGSVKLQSLDELFQQEKLQLLSKIELQNVKVDFY